MKIYIASSWRNRERVNEVDGLLKSRGHETFNFTNPGEHSALPYGFHWTEIDHKWKEWTPAEYRDALKHEIALAGLSQDFNAMQWADACVAVQPFGRSASLELGWFIGQGKPAVVILDDGEPELMLGLAKLCLTDHEAAAYLKAIETPPR